MSATNSGGPKISPGFVADRYRKYKQAHCIAKSIEYDCRDGFNHSQLPRQCELTKPEKLWWIPSVRSINHMVDINWWRKHNGAVHIETTMMDGCVQGMLTSSNYNNSAAKLQSTVHYSWYHRLKYIHRWNILNYIIHLWKDCLNQFILGYSRHKYRTCSG